MTIQYPHYREILAEHSAAWSDFYALTMGQAAHTLGINRDVITMHAFIRSAPFGGSHIVTGGQEVLLEHLQNYWKFDEIDCENMRNAMMPNAEGVMERIFTDEFIDECANTPLDLTIDCMPEGEIAFPDEPIYRVHGRTDQAWMIEAALLNASNSQSLFATLGARTTYAAQGSTVLEFGLRRAQDVGGLAPSRGAYIGGIEATSNNLAHKYYGIPRRGTFAHAWVMLHEDEMDAFANYAKAMPNSGIFLVDTYDTLEGVKKAIKACQEYGVELKGIRLDSGDLAYLSIESRKLLDEEGFSQAIVTASNDLDEKIIEDLINNQGAKIDAWGVGTSLVTAKSQPALGMVYKLGAVFESGMTAEMVEEIRKRMKAGENPSSENFMREVIKLSEDNVKVTIPGELDLLRYMTVDADGKPIKYHSDTIISNLTKDPLDRDWLNRDVISVHKGDDSLRKTFTAGTRAYRPLVRAMENGQRTTPTQTIHQSRERAAQSLGMLDDSHRRFMNPHRYVVGLEEGLKQKRDFTMMAARGHDI